jgi:hypothetical protein
MNNKLHLLMYATLWLNIKYVTINTCSYTEPLYVFCMLQAMIVCLAILLFVKMVTSLIGFDCSGQYLNITVISLLDIEECGLHISKPNTTNVYIQLLQFSEYNYAEILQCKIEISRTIYYCGMHSHISVCTTAKLIIFTKLGTLNADDFFKTENFHWEQTTW